MCRLEVEGDLTQRIVTLLRHARVLPYIRLLVRSGQTVYPTIIGPEKVKRF